MRIPRLPMDSVKPTDVVKANNYLEAIADLLKMSRHIQVLKSSYDGERANSGEFRLIHKSPEEPSYTTISNFDLKRLPGCCGVCVSCHASIVQKFRGNGLGTLLNKMRLVMARQMGYGMLICTDISTNKPQCRILEKNNWKHLITFNNPRTSNDVLIHSFNLNELKDNFPLGFNCKAIAPDFFILGASNNVESVELKED